MKKNIKDLSMKRDITNNTDLLEKILSSINKLTEAISQQNKLKERELKINENNLRLDTFKEKKKLAENKK